MALGSARKAWLTCAVVGVFGATAAGCGDDPSVSPPPGGGKLHPVPGCEAIDPSPCDVFYTSCQTRLMELAACLRGSPSQALPPVSRMTEAEYAQRLTDLIVAEDPPPNLNHYEAALVTLGLVVPGAFAPSSMAAAQAAWVWGVYRHDTDDIVLVDHGRPGDDVQVNGVFVHELVHALQDRDQDLGAWYDGRRDSYDGALAAMSVVEGEARLHQKRFGVSLLGLDPNAVDVAKHLEGAVSLGEKWVREQPSPYLASYSVFPYEFGARRLWPRFMQGGAQAIADLFSAPPTGTRALLDPADDAAVPAWPAPGAPVPPPEWTLTQETTLGAWALYLVLGHFEVPGDANLIARGWRGDRLWVYGGIGAPAVAVATALVWRIAFADEATATLVSQLVPPQFFRRQAGAEVIIAANDGGVAINWAFGEPTQSAAAPGGDERALATGPSVGDWLNRIFARVGR